MKTFPSVAQWWNGDSEPCPLALDVHHSLKPVRVEVFDIGLPQYGSHEPQVATKPGNGAVPMREKMSAK